MKSLIKTEKKLSKRNQKFYKSKFKSMKNLKLKLNKKIVSFVMFSSLVLASNPIVGYAQGNPIRFEEETLNNGLHVIYNFDKSAPVVSTVVHYKVGSKDEASNRTGFAHFFEHLMFEATDHIPRATIDKYVNSTGGDLNAHTSFDETVYKFTLPSNELKLALWIEASRMRNLQVAEIGVETQRGVVKEERNVRVDNSPYGDVLERIMSPLFDGSSYSWTTIGKAEHINQATISEFKDFYNKFYQPNNAILVISGNINIADAKQYVKEYFENIPKGSEIERNEFKLQDLKGEFRDKVFDEKIQLPGLFIAWRAPKMGEKDAYAMELLNQILSTGESSRLYKKVVDEKELAAQVSNIVMPLQNSGLAAVIAFPLPGKSLQDIEESVYDEIDKIAKDGVSDKELKKAKNIIETNLVSSKKDCLEKAMLLAKYYAYYKNTSLINKEVENYLDVNNEDIKRVAKKYLATKNRIVISYYPKTN